MKKTFFLLLLISSAVLQAQYYRATLLMVDGSSKEGFSKLPSNQMLDKKIEFKEAKRSPVQKIEEDEVHRILVTSDAGDQFLFERNNVVHLFKAYGKQWEKEKVNKHWMLLIHANDVLQEYSLAQRYKFDKKDRLMSITGAHSFWETIYFLLRKYDEEKAYIVSGKGFTNGMVRKAMAIYFEDLPEFVERIENKEFKKANVSDVADAYAEYFD